MKKQLLASLLTFALLFSHVQASDVGFNVTTQTPLGAAGDGSVQFGMRLVSESQPTCGAGEEGRDAGGGLLDCYSEGDGFVIDGDGKVGIGIPNPTTTLDVSGALTVSGDSSFDGNVGIGTSAPTTKLHVISEDPIDSYTKLLVQSDTTDGDVAFVDTSGNAHSITANGDVHHETDQAKIGATSVAYDGTGDRLTMPYSSDFDLGSPSGTDNDFTLDAWFMTSAIKQYNSLISKRTAGQADGWHMSLYDGKLTLTAKIGGASKFQSKNVP